MRKGGAQERGCLVVTQLRESFMRHGEKETETEEVSVSTTGRERLRGCGRVTIMKEAQRRGNADTVCGFV